MLKPVYYQDDKIEIRIQESMGGSNYYNVLYTVKPSNILLRLRINKGFNLAQQMKQVEQQRVLCVMSEIEHSFEADAREFAIHFLED